MFERFTDRARRIVAFSQEEARAMNHNYIGTEHLLLGMCASDQKGESVAAKTLATFDLGLERLRNEVGKLIGPGGDDVVVGAHIPFTPRAKKVLELSLREALQLGHNYIGTEHLLLGLIREGEGVGAEVLRNCGLQLSEVRQRVIQLLSGYAGVPTGTLHPSAGAEAARQVERMASRLRSKQTEVPPEDRKPDVHFAFHLEGEKYVVTRVTVEVVATFTNVDDAGAVATALTKKYLAS